MTSYYLHYYQAMKLKTCINLNFALYQITLIFVVNVSLALQNRAKATVESREKKDVPTLAQVYEVLTRKSGIAW